MRQIRLLQQKIREIEDNAINSINYLIKEIDINDKNPYFEVDKNSFYKFTQDLTVRSGEVKTLWYDNEEKANYYKTILNNYNKDINKLIDQYNKINSRFNLGTNSNLLSRHSKIREMQRLVDNRIDSFLKYIEQRHQYMEADYKSCKVGLEGEERVNEELALYDNYINLKNIRLEVLDNNNNIQSIENDNILLTRNGIFILEVKNLGEIGNYDIIIEKDGRWLRKNKNTKKTDLLKNVTSQNNRHIGFLNKFINESMHRSFDNYIEADGIIVIANEKVTIENYNENQNIFRTSELRAYINKQPVKFKKEELDKIKKVIEENNLRPKKYSVYDYYSEIQSNTQVLKDFIIKYEYIVDSVLALSKKYNSDTEPYEYKLKNNNFYCKNCHKKVSATSERCANCSHEETLTEEELKRVKEELMEIQKKIQKKKKKKRKYIFRLVIILIIILIRILYSIVFDKLSVIKYVINHESEGLYVARLKNGLFSYANENGERVIDGQYESAELFKDGVARVMKYGLYGYINKSGEFIVKPQFNFAYKEFKDGMAKVEKKGLYGYVSKNGVVIEPQFESAFEFNEGLAAVRKDGLYGFINKSGEFIIEPQFEYADEFSEGLAAVEKNGLYGYINKNGEIVIEPKFEFSGSFSDGLAYIRKNGLYGYINKSGEIVIEPQFEYADNFNNGAARVCIDKILTEKYINKNGEILD